jgi:exonuclease SbcC
MAAELAGQLIPGNSCPVCGSDHHPQPFVPNEPEADADHEAAVTPLRLDQLQAQARQQLLDNNRLQVMLNGIVQQWQPMLAQMQSNQFLTEAAAAFHSWRLPVKDQPSVPVSPLPAVEELIREYQTAESGLGLAKQQEQRLQRELQKLLQDRGQIDRLAGDRKSNQQSLHHLINASQQKISSLMQTVQEQIKAWNERFTSLTYGTLESAAEQQRLQEQQAEELRRRFDKSVSFIEEKLELIAGLQDQVNSLDRTFIQQQTELKSMQQLEAEKAAKLYEWAGEESVEEQVSQANRQLEQLRSAFEQNKQALEKAQADLQQASQVHAAAGQAAETAAEQAALAEAEWLQQAALLDFTDPVQVQAALIPDDQKRVWSAEAEAFEKLKHQLESRQQQLSEQLGGRSITEDAWAAWESELAECKRQDEAALQAQAKAERDWESLQTKHQRWSELEGKRTAKQDELTLLGKLQNVLRGNAFVEFLAEEQLTQVSRSASERLGQLTRQKYAIEVDSAGGFVIRDDANGGVKRPVSTLSGGETFLTSLSLALALSAQIQLKGQYPLEFFFLDEGFGTLDQDLLETVIIALEKLHFDRLTVGVISHVPELRARLPRRLVVQPPEPGGRGSTVFIETL